MAVKSKKYEIDMCNGPILGKLLLFTVPLMASSILQLLFNTADIIVVGKYVGDNALAAVGSNSSLINLLTNFFIGLSVGVNVLVSRYYGSSRKDELSDTVHTSILISIISGIILSFIGFIGAPVILTWMSVPENVLPLSILYIRVYFLGMTSTMLYNFGASILRAVGDTRRPLYYLTIAGVINVILNLIFVIGFNLSVAGVALATIISQTVSAVLVIRCLVTSDSVIKLDLKKLRLDKDKTLKIIRIGLPASVQGMLFSFSNVIIQSSINGFGEIVVAGSSAASNLEGYVYVSMNSFYQATISFVSTNLGARKYERINRIVILALCSVTVVGLALGNLVYFFGVPLLSIYTSSEAVIEAGLIRLLFICCPYFLCGLMDTIVGAIRGLGYSVMPMIVSLIGACGLRLIWIFTFFRLDYFHSPEMLYITYPVSWTVTFLTHVICFIIVRRKLSLQVRE
ncbi:MAG: MATE family efflux transporter [Butyrivibrio sp.]|nr:MATE family efflux transporter [Butyrivibrio sp.]